MARQGVFCKYSSFVSFANLRICECIHATERIAQMCKFSSSFMVISNTVVMTNYSETFILIVEYRKGLNPNGSKYQSPKVHKCESILQIDTNLAT